MSPDGLGDHAKGIQTSIKEKVMNWNEVKRGGSAMVCAVVLAGGCLHADVSGKQGEDVDHKAVTQSVKADAYAKSGFYTELDKDGRLWVFVDGSDDHKSYKEAGKPAKQVRRPGAGPDGVTIISTEMETITAYLVAQPGFYTNIDKDGRLWVLVDGSDDHKSYQEKGKPAKQVRRPGAGPLGLTVISTEMETIDAYLAAF